GRLIRTKCCPAARHLSGSWGRRAATLAVEPGPDDEAAGHIPLRFPSLVIPSAQLPRRPGSRSLRPRPGRPGPASEPSPGATLGCDAARSAVAPRQNGRGSPAAVVPSEIWPLTGDLVGATEGSPAIRSRTDPFGSATSAVRW